MAARAASRRWRSASSSAARLTVAVHPSKPLVAGGFNTGNVLIGATRKGEAVVAQARTGVPVTAMAWSPYGDTVAAADSGGRLSLFALAADLKVH